MGRTLSAMVHRKWVRGVGRSAGQRDDKRSVHSISEAGGCASWPVPRGSALWEQSLTERCGLKGEWRDLQKARLKLWLGDHSGESVSGGDIWAVPFRLRLMGGRLWNGGPL